MNQEQINELLYQALETEMGGVHLYETAVKCAVNEDLKEEWEEYLEQTKTHVERLKEVLESLGLDARKETPGRKVVRHLGEALVKAMEMARKEAKPEAAELVAGECIILAESKDHMNWELIGQVVKSSGRNGNGVLRKAHREVEDEEDEHLYHTMGWTRELWMKSLGLKAVIPPPEEARDVKTMAEAARAKKSREGPEPADESTDGKTSKRGRPVTKKSSSRKSSKRSSSRS